MIRRQYKKQLRASAAEFAAASEAAPFDTTASLVHSLAGRSGSATGDEASLSPSGGSAAAAKYMYPQLQGVVRTVFVAEAKQEVLLGDGGSSSSSTTTTTTSSSSSSGGGGDGGAASGDSERLRCLQLVR